jgi:hypothetical protein
MFSKRGFVAPAQAGAQDCGAELDPGLRRDDMRGSVLPRFNARLRFIANQVG